MLERMTEELSRAKGDRDRTICRAEELANAGYYGEAIKLLEAVPECLRTRHFNDVLNRCTSGQTMVVELRQAVRNQGSAGQYTEAQVRKVQQQVRQLIQLQPNDAQLQIALERWEQLERSEDERLWEFSRRQASAEAFRHYLDSFPSGAHVKLAQHMLASGLRRSLLQDFAANSRQHELRREYLRVRTPTLAEEDDARALLASAVGCAIAGAIGGAFAGIVLGAVDGTIGGLIGGFVGGSLAAIYAERS
jgi:hypothetical protein